MEEKTKILCDKIKNIVNQIPLKEREMAIEAVLDVSNDQIDLPANEQSNSIRYALNEFDIAFPDWREDPMQKSICLNIINLIKVFSLAGHSGFSASYTIPKLTSLLKFEPLTKLTFNDDEFEGIQNKRLSSVFKEKDGRYHYLYSNIHQDIVQIIIDDSHNVVEVNDVRDKNLKYSGSFPIVIMNDGSFAKVSRVLIKDPEKFDWKKRYVVPCISVGNDGWWETFTTEAEMRKVEEDYDLIYEIFEKPSWFDFGENCTTSEEKFGKFNELFEKIKPFINYLQWSGKI